MTSIAFRHDFDQHSPVSAEQAYQLEPTVGDFRSRGQAEVITIRHGLLARQQRGRFFNPRLFADPAWDMLLELYAAALVERRLTISRLVERVHVPMTTGLRWIRTLEAEGLIEREPDRLDGRRIYISLTRTGRSAMGAYFDELHPDARIL